MCRLKCLKTGYVKRIVFLLLQFCVGCWSNFDRLYWNLWKWVMAYQIYDLSDMIWSWWWLECKSNLLYITLSLVKGGKSFRNNFTLFYVLFCFLCKYSILKSFPSSKCQLFKLPVRFFFILAFLDFLEIFKQFLLIHRNLVNPSCLSVM